MPKLTEASPVKEEHLALIVARPGRIRDSLYLLLKAASPLKSVLLADDTSSALTAIAKHRPALVVLSAAPANGDMQAVLTQIRSVSPQTRCLVLADTTRQEYLAKSAGADSVLLAGFPITRLYAAIVEVLSWPPGQPAPAATSNLPLKGGET